MKEKLMSEAIITLLNENGIKRDEILNTCPIDLAFSCKYIKGYVFLTKDYLGVVTSEPLENQVILFRGTKVKDEDIKDDMLLYDLKLYPLEGISTIRLHRMLATNYIYAVRDGIEEKLCAFTNTYIEQMNTFIKAYKVMRNEEDTSVAEDMARKASEEESEKYCPVCGTMYPDAERKMCPKCMNKKSVFFRTMKYFMRYKWRFMALFLCYIAAAAISLVWPYLSGSVLYDEVLALNDDFLAKYGLAGKYATALLILVMIMVVSKIIQQIISMLQMTFMAQIVAKVVRDIKQDVFSSMGRLSINFFTSKQTGSLMTRVLSDADRVTGFYLDGFPYIFIHGFTIIVSFVVMFNLNWKMALVSCVLLPLLVFLSVKLRPKLWSLFGRRHRAERAVNGKVNDNLTGARVVKAFGQQEAEIDRFEKPNSRLKRAEIRIVKYNNRFTILYNFVQEISSIWVWIIGVFMILKTKEMELGVLVTFVGYVAQLNGPMNFFAMVFHMWTDSINSAQRMYEIMDAVPEIVEADNPVRLDNPRGEIELKNVTFGYDVNKPVLKDISLKIKEGEMLGVVGRSGAGKTTLVNLISRLYDTNEGEIYIDGENVKNIALNDLRRNVAMVSQDTYIFMGTVAENIAYANPEATKEDVIKAAMLASAHEFICNMPDGYDTVIGASGKDLSGGEKQRISIARAILANPKILILDEATASVDTATEKAIQQSINYLIKGRTTISIAHRLSTLRDADSLVVIDGGRITERGTAKELMELKGTYYTLMELQTKALALRGLEI